MKLVQARDSYYWYTEKASDVARTLAFAGIALIWIFKVGDSGTPRIPHRLLPPTFFLAGSLILDLLQYVVASILWGGFHRFKEKTIPAGEDPEFEAPAWMNWPAILFFYGKLILVALGFLLLIRYTLKTWLE